MQNVTPVVTVKGLQTQDSELSAVEAGSLQDCNNIVVGREGVIEPRRGFALYGDSMGASATLDVARQLFTYKGRILRHFGANGGSTLQYDNGSGTFSSFNGNYTETSVGTKMASSKANGNFYFTTSSGVKKISASSASQFTTGSGYITNAGGLKALDAVATLNPQSGFFTQNSKVAYRIIWGIKDANNNLILGSPSQRVVVENSQTDLLIRDFNALLAQLDNSANDSGTDELTDTDYVSTLKVALDESNPQTLRNNLVLLADKLERDVNLIADSSAARNTATGQITGNVATLTFSTNLPAWVLPGIEIKCSGFTHSNLLGFNNTFTVSSTTVNSVSFPLTAADTGPHSDNNGTVTHHQFNSLPTPEVPSAPATTTELDDIQTYYDGLVELLQLNPLTKNPADFDTNSSTQSSTVNVRFTIPQEATLSHFYQVYRTAVFRAEGQISLDDVDPGDELGLVFESNPTADELTAREIVMHDITPESFRGANAYTNPQSGEGILQSNELPPACTDMTLFKGSLFYANTRTRHRLQFSLLGVSNFTSGTSSITVATENGASTYTFHSPVAEESTFTTVADVAGSLAGKHFTFNTGLNTKSYYAWYNVSGSGVDPAIAGKTGIEIEIATDDTADDVASATRLKLNQLSDFVISGTADEVVITCITKGITDDATVGDSGFSVVIVEGSGEDSDNNKVLLSDLETPAQQVEETTRSLVRVMNKDINCPVNAFYLSGVSDVPGSMLFETKALDEPKFYVSCNTTTTGLGFNPNLPGRKTITAISVANPTVVSSVAHGLSTGDEIAINDSDSSPVIDGTYTVTVLDANTFTVPVTTVNPAGTTGSFAKTTVASDNETSANRIYFSKFQQPEAVPIVNFIDVGAKDSAILRIVPLRDSLFVFKENEGVFRISGESALSGFLLSPFDSSTVLTAQDSPAVLNNQIYALSNQGVISVSDTGISVVSKGIEDNLIPLVQHTYFKDVTFGVSYESERSYLLFTTTSRTDEEATVCFVYNVFTNAWTKWDISKSCGIVLDDILYLGAADTNYIEKERKNFERQDYSDRQYIRTLNTGAVDGVEIEIGSVANISVGDVIVQEQYLTIYKLNQLLQKLDDDSGVTDEDYLSTLNVVAGSNLRDKLTTLATKLDADTGVNDTDYAATIAGYGTSFADTQSAFNAIVSKLNLDVGVSYLNYSTSTGTTSYEAIIETITSSNNTITVSDEYPFIAGTVTIYNHIPVSVTFNVQTFGNPELFKQVSEAKFIFDRTDFTKARVSFASDISPAHEEVDFTQYGNGTFGNAEFGNAHFGGMADRSPLRTYVPRNKQRCRLLIPRIEHAVARENMALLGYSVTFRTYSYKAYK